MLAWFGRYGKGQLWLTCAIGSPEYCGSNVNCRETRLPHNATNRSFGSRQIQETLYGTGCRTTQQELGICKGAMIGQSHQAIIGIRCANRSDGGREF